MPDEAALAVIRQIWGDRPESPAPADNISPTERFLQYKRLNTHGWARLIARKGLQGVREYRDAMRELGKGLGLEDS